MICGIGAHAVVEGSALGSELHLAGAGPDQEAVQGVGQALQRRRSLLELLRPLRHLFLLLFRPLFFLGDPPLLDLPVVGGGEVPWKPDQAVREVPAILCRHPPVVPEGAPVLLLPDQVADRAPKIRLGGLLQDQVAIVAFDQLQHLHILRQSDWDAAIPDLPVFFQVRGRPLSPPHLPELLLCQSQHLCGPFLLPIDILQLRDPAPVIAADLFAADPFLQQAAAALDHQILHLRTPAPQGEIAHQPLAIGLLVQVQLAVFRRGALQQGALPGDHEARLAAHVAEGLPLPPLAEQACFICRNSS